MATECTEIAELIADVREHVLYLRELGVNGLTLDLHPNGPALVAAQEPSLDIAERISDLESRISRPNAEPRSIGSRLASLPKLRPPAVSHISDGTRPDLFEVPPALPEPTETIEQIREEIGLLCTRCPLSTMGRSQVVNSVGNFNAELMFCGEAPGADEDRLGEPFVGRAGQLLTDIIEKGLKMSRQDVFIGNINRCRPPGNRTPFPDEAAVCKPFLLREIAVVRPKVIVVLGATAAHNLLETKVPISKLRGHFHDYLGVKVMSTFHPAYLLRDPHKKREVWEDMKLVRDYLKNGIIN